MNKFIVSALTIVSVLSSSASFAPNANANIEDNEIKFAIGGNIKIAAANCKKNKKLLVNGKCLLFSVIADKNTLAYPKQYGVYSPIGIKLKMFKTPIFGDVSIINVVDYDKDYVYGYTNNESIGTTLYKMKRSQVSINYGC